MCGRFANTFDAAALTALFQTAIPLSNSRPLPAYNITPGTRVPVILAGDSTRKAEYMHWGIASPVPATNISGGKAASRGLLINARAETMTEKPTFRKAALDRRCVVLASGWYEWKAPKKPYYISRTDGAPMAFAGLYWGGELSSTVIITTAADAGLADIHHRAPLQIPVDGMGHSTHNAGHSAIDAWLDSSQSAEQINRMTAPSSAAPLTWHPVSPDVGRNTENHEGLIEAYDAAAHDPQPTLF
jgi:putative SOS response-associated peptidase YedK